MLKLSQQCLFKLIRSDGRRKSYWPNRSATAQFSSRATRSAEIAVSEIRRHIAGEVICPDNDPKTATTGERDRCEVQHQRWSRPYGIAVGARANCLFAAAKLWARAGNHWDHLFSATVGSLEMYLQLSRSRWAHTIRIRR